MTGKAKLRQGDGKAVAMAKAEQDDEAMDYLLKPSLPFVAGLTLRIAIAKATAVAKIRIKQFLAIPLTGKVVAGACMMSLPLFIFLCEAVAEAHARANAKNLPPPPFDNAVRMNRRNFNPTTHITLNNEPVFRVKQAWLEWRVFIESMIFIGHIVKEWPQLIALGIEGDSTIHPNTFLADVVDHANLVSIMKQLHFDLNQP